jgi:hypothetical protein
MSAAPIQIVIPKPQARTPAEDLRRLELAPAADGDADRRNLELASRLLSLDRFDAAIERLSGGCAAPQAFRWAQVLGHSHFFRRRAGDLEAAREAYARAGACAPNRPLRAIALADLGRALLALEDPVAARRAFEAALAQDPLQPHARMNLALLDLRAGHAAQVLAQTDALIAAGNTGGGVLAAHRLALAATSTVGPALEGLVEAELQAPPGWPSLKAFNANLAEELIDHPARHPSRTGGETGDRLRIDAPWIEGSRCMPALVKALAAKLPPSLATMTADDAWRASRPQRATLSLWAVLTRNQGHDTWHTHLHGWLSGVYYVRTPPSADGGGSIEFGQPDLEGVDALAGERRRVQPRPGLLLLFPSHLHHRTHPSRAPSWRVSVAFDLVPDAVGRG